MISNKLEKTFGTAGSFAGYILILFGVMVLVSWVGVLLVVIGLFFAFSFSGVTIEIDKNRFKQYTKLFGLIKVGDWDNLSMYDKFLVKKNDNVFRVFSRGNRSVDSQSDTYLVCIVNSNENVIVPVMKCRTYDQVVAKAAEMSELLNIPVEDNSNQNVN